jgi:hypothetical protein
MKRKRITAALGALCAALTLLCAGCTSLWAGIVANWVVVSVGPYKGLKGFVYSEDGTLIAYSDPSSVPKDFVIPKRLGNTRITRIFGNPYAFSNVFSGIGLTSVIIPDSVTTIDTWAFANNRLTSVTIPNSVTDLSGFNNNQITSITIPNSVTTIGNSAFAGNRLTSVTSPGSVTRIDMDAFANNQLTSVTIPNSVTNLSGFSNNQITSITIPGSVTAIGENAFANNQLTSVTIPGSVTRIDKDAFANNRLTGVTIPNSVTAIGENAFANNQITSVTLSYNNTNIKPDFFGQNLAVAYHVSFNRQAGTYIRQGDRWSLNGVAASPNSTLTLEDGIYLGKLDPRLSGGSPPPPGGWMRLDDINGYVSGIGVKRVVLKPGLYDIEVGYRDARIYSKGTVTFEQRYFFEEGNYTVTGTPEGDQIIFHIQRTN